MKWALYWRQHVSCKLNISSIKFYLFSLEGVSMLSIRSLISWTLNPPGIIITMFARPGSASRCRPRTWGHSTGEPLTQVTSVKRGPRLEVTRSLTSSVCRDRGQEAPAFPTTSAQRNSTDSGATRNLCVSFIGTGIPGSDSINFIFVLETSLRRERK